LVTLTKGGHDHVWDGIRLHDPFVRVRASCDDHRDRWLPPSS
jgi:hypothetical protein